MKFGFMPVPYLNKDMEGVRQVAIAKHEEMIAFHRSEVYDEMNGALEDYKQKVREAILQTFYDIKDEDKDLPIDEYKCNLLRELGVGL